MFTTWGWASHYYPLVPLGWACRAAGHEVRVASQPALIDTIVQSGLPAVRVGKDVDFSALFGRTMGPLVAIPEDKEAQRKRVEALKVVPFRMFAEVASHMAGDLIEYCRSWKPDVIVYEPTSYAALVAASAVGVPAVRHVWSADYPYYGRAGESEVIPQLFADFGSKPIDTLGTMTLDACPPSMQIATDYRRQLVQYVPYNGAGEAPEWLLEPTAARRVCLTWGTTVSRLHNNMFGLPALVDALSTLPDTELVLAVNSQQRELLSHLPSNVKVVENLPLNLLLATCSAQVQQGGAGTTMTALAAGVPQLVVPQIPDQLFNARQLASTGAGTFIPYKEATPDDLRRLLHEVLAKPDYAESAKRVAAEIKQQPTPSDVVGALEGLAS
nr:nucleotide disphospho-sugar-binding domain-containing protein [Kibdelosporangium phytohabitans]